MPWKLSKKQCDQNRSIIFAPSTWPEDLSNFFVFILFWNIEIAYLKNKKYP
jgi:hypothetical protein